MNDKCIHEIVFRIFEPKDSNALWPVDLVVKDRMWNDLSKKEKRKSLDKNPQLKESLARCSEHCVIKDKEDGTNAS
jgi:hypothetical protein